jgi:hypothetical protein
MPPEASGPPRPIIPVLIVPRIPPPAGSNARPAPIRLHRRPQRNAPRTPTVAPLPVPAAEPAAAPPRPASPVHPAPKPEGPKGDVKTALRGGAVGCANPLAVGLTRAERDLCDERLGKGAKEAEFIPPGLALTAAKRALLDKAAAAREARRADKERQPPPAMMKPGPADYDGEPYISGAGASALGTPAPKPSGRAARTLGRLPP